MTGDAGPSFLTTKEVADLLRVKERKVYDLAAAGEIPHRRITGKLLFPLDEINTWIAGDTAVPRPDVVAGSHDPLLDWAIRESRCSLATLFDGSGDGLRRFTARQAALAGLHIPEDDGWNLTALANSGARDAVLLGWARRHQGLIVAKDSRIGGLDDLNGSRVVLRQPGAGSRDLFDRLTADLDLSRARFLDAPARTETDAAETVASGEADVALGLSAAANRLGLSFIPVAEEQFDLLIDRRAYFTPPVQMLLEFTRTPAFRDKAATLGGYDLAGLGSVRWNSD